MTFACIRTAPAHHELFNGYLFERSLSMRLTRNVGMLLLAIWLIITGAVPLLNLSFSGINEIMAVLAIAAGVLILVGR